MFLELKAERIAAVYHYLRRHNGSMFLGAFGMDYYWVHENITRKPLRYSDFNFGNRLRDDREPSSNAVIGLVRPRNGSTKPLLRTVTASLPDYMNTGLAINPYTPIRQLSFLFPYVQGLHQASLTAFISHCASS